MKTGLLGYGFQSSSSQGLFVDFKTLYLFGIPCSYEKQPGVIYLVGVLALRNLCPAPHTFRVIIPNYRGYDVVI